MKHREDKDLTRRIVSSPTHEVFSQSRSSLSMKMRSDSVTLGGSHPATPAASVILPEVRKRRCSNIHLTPPIPKSDVAMMYEKLSGLYETQGFEAFPSRGTVVHPTTLCVRCASHASLCVPCADIMAQESVTFFRKSQAVGAFHLLDGAIKQAGAQKALRFIVFRCWKNSLRLRKYGRGKRESITLRAWQLHMLRTPFKNWVVYTRECQFERRDKRIEQLEDKVKILEQQVFKLSAEKSSAEKHVRKLLVEKSESEMFVANQQEIIKDLENQLLLERSRVLRLARHMENTTPHMISIAKSAIKSALAASVRHINLTQTINLSALNMAKILKTSGPAAKVKAAADKESDGPSEQLLAWVNYMSKSAVGVTVKVESGEALLLDDYLPLLQPARSIESLKNGKQIARVVLRMVAQVLDVPSAPPKPARPMRPAAPPPDAPPPAAPSSTTEPPPPSTITTQQLQELKDSADVPHSLVYLIFALMSSYLKCPSFPLERIIAGKGDSIEVVVHYLLLVWTALPGHTLTKEEKAENHKIQEKQAAVLSDMESLCDARCRAHALHIPELTPPEPEPSKVFNEGVTPGKGQKDGQPDLHVHVMSAYSEEKYAAVGEALELYLTQGGAGEMLTMGLSELEKGIRDVTDFTNSVYMKQKTSAAGLQFSMTATRLQTLHCTRKLLSTSGWVKRKDKVEMDVDDEG